jgi:hypothetical protein
VPLGGESALDAAVRRLLPVVVHDLRNGLGVVGVQLEALLLRALGPLADEARARGHGDAAALAVETLAAQLDALAAFARGGGRDLATVAAEAAALVPMRRIAVSGFPADGPPTALAPALLRAIVLELLLHTLDAAGPWALAGGIDPDGRPALVVRAGRPLGPAVAAERLVQTAHPEASLALRDGTLVLTCPTS